MEIRGKRIVLTGAGSGIGAELLARLRAYEGVRIVAADLRPDAVPPAANVLPYRCDVGDVAQVDLLFDYAKDTLGGIDLFIANAGFAYYEQIQRADWARIDAIYRVNVYSPIYAALKMREQYGDREMMVVITASTMALLGVPGYALYASTKAALHRFADAYRYELAEHQRLLMVYPIATRTGFFSHAGNTSGKPAAPTLRPSQTPGYVAGRIIRGIERDARTVSPSALFRALELTQGLFLLAGKGIQRLYLRDFRRWQRQA